MIARRQRSAHVKGHRRLAERRERHTTRRAVHRESFRNRERQRDRLRYVGSRLQVHHERAVDRNPRARQLQLSVESHADRRYARHGAPQLAPSGIGESIDHRTGVHDQRNSRDHQRGARMRVEQALLADREVARLFAATRWQSEHVAHAWTRHPPRVAGARSRYGDRDAPAAVRRERHRGPRGWRSRVAQRPGARTREPNLLLALVVDRHRDRERIAHGDQLARSRRLDEHARGREQRRLCPALRGLDRDREVAVDPRASGGQSVPCAWQLGAHRGEQSEHARQRLHHRRGSDEALHTSHRGHGVGERVQRRPRGRTQRRAGEPPPPRAQRLEHRRLAHDRGRHVRGFELHVIEPRAAPLQRTESLRQMLRPAHRRDLGVRHPAEGAQLPDVHRERRVGRVEPLRAVELRRHPRAEAERGAAREANGVRRRVERLARQDPGHLVMPVAVARRTAEHGHDDRAAGTHAPPSPRRAGSSPSASACTSPRRSWRIRSRTRA